MLPESLKRKIDFEFESIDRELRDTEDLFNEIQYSTPGPVAIRAIATTLHAFYNGIEKIFSLIARDVDGASPDGDRWHASLLHVMSVPAAQRKQVISESGKLRLEKYLAFRHYFRHSYGFTLDWEHLKPLCMDLKGTYQMIKEEIIRFSHGST